MDDSGESDTEQEKNTQVEIRKKIHVEHYE